MRAASTAFIGGTKFSPDGVLRVREKEVAIHMPGKSLVTIVFVGTK